MHLHVSVPLVVIFSSHSLTKKLREFFIYLSRATCLAHLNFRDSLTIIIVGKEFVFWSTSFCNFASYLIVHLSWVQIFFSAICSQTPQFTHSHHSERPSFRRTHMLETVDGIVTSYILTVLFVKREGKWKIINWILEVLLDFNILI